MSEQILQYPADLLDVPADSSPQGTHTSRCSRTFARRTCTLLVWLLVRIIEMETFLDVCANGARFIIGPTG